MFKNSYTTAQRLRLLRFFSGKNQSELSEILGVTQGWLSKLESGEGDLSARQCLAIREQFGIPVDAFLDGVIDWLAISQRFSHPVPIPLRFRLGAKSEIRLVRGLIGFLAEKLGEETVKEECQRLKFRPELLASVSVRVNLQLFIDWVGVGLRHSLLKSAADWERVAQLTLTPWKTLSAKDVAAGITDDPLKRCRAIVAFGQQVFGDFQFEIVRPTSNSCGVTIQFPGDASQYDGSFSEGFTAVPQLFQAWFQQKGPDSEEIEKIKEGHKIRAEIASVDPIAHVSELRVVWT
jgi:transcriptional regulator with XRE-family HTH domain